MAGSKAHEDRWTRGDYTRDELLDALLAEGMAGEVAHDRMNVFGKVQRMVLGDPDVTFGLSGMTRYEAGEVMALIDRSIKFEPGHGWEGPTIVDPETILESLEAMGDRLALAAERGEEVLITTGHPV
ncbi:MAG: phosphatase, partial [Actinomycetota bacterium]